MTTLPPLSIWYLSALVRCNFKCAYCASGQPFIQGTNEWLTDDGLEKHQKIMKWIALLPYQIKLRINTIGEPFASKTYLETVSELTHANNLDYVEILTNGSYTPGLFQTFIKSSNLSKLSFWMTYHPTEIKLEKFITSAKLAKDAGIFVVVHALLFPDSIESTQLLEQECLKHGLTFHVGFGTNFFDAYPKKGFLPILDVANVDSKILDLNVAFPVQVYKIAESPFGSNCSAGKDYIFITSEGEVHQCKTYSKSHPASKLGSALDSNFMPMLRQEKFAVCLMQVRCNCTEDYQHLEAALKSYSLNNPSFVPCSKKDFKN